MSQDVAWRGFDRRSRLERIGYPALAWLTAGGRASLVPDSLVAVNIVALGALGLGGGLLARDGGRHAVWGLVFPGYWGYLFLGAVLCRETAVYPVAALGLVGMLGRDHRQGIRRMEFAASLLWWSELAILVAVTAAAVWSVGRTSAPLYERSDVGLGCPRSGSTIPL